VREKLTKKVVEAILPGAIDVVVWDTEVRGFGVKVTKAGRRAYFLYYRTRAGQQRRPTIGQHGAITADQARQTAREWMAAATLGGDISGDRTSDRTAVTMSQLAERYLRDYAAHHKKPSSIASDKGNLENHVIPLLGTRKVKDLRRADIETVKLAVRDGRTARNLPAKKRGRRLVRGGEGVANRVMALLSKMFACAEEWGIRSDNPARGVRKFREHRKDRFLSDEEVGKLLRVLDQTEVDGSESPFAVAAIRLLMFTGMRHGEVVGLHWGDVDEKSKCLRLSDTKTGARVIPLSAEAYSAIAGLTRLEADKRVFSADGDSEIALRRPWYRLRDLADIDDTANLHSLRHTFASWSVMDGLSLAQVGALLGHRSTQTTLRYADHAVEALRSYGQQTSSKLARMSESKK
jgi:integrase